MDKISRWTDGWIDENERVYTSCTSVIVHRHAYAPISPCKHHICVISKVEVIS